MNIHDYLIEHQGIDWSLILASWASKLPPQFTLWLVNRFGDLFLIFDDASIHMLRVDVGVVNKVADSRDDFCIKLDEENNSNDWLMIPLVNELVEAGIRIKAGECYGYKIPPVLGGDYTVENSAVLPLAQHYAFHADLHEQIKDVPDGAKVVIRVINVPDKAPPE